MSSTEKFCLKWNDFQENITSSFRELKENCDFTDVTLVCEGDQQIEAHKVILSASSPVFRKLLSTYKKQSPLIYLRGVASKHLISLLDFIYQGEANVFQEDLNDFLALAEEFKLKGLHETTSIDERSETEKPINSIKSEVRKITKNSERGNYTPMISEDFNRHINLSINESDELDKMTEIVQGYFATNLDNNELDETIKSMIEKHEDGWGCKSCGKSTKKKKDLKKHIEVHIDGMKHPCNTCGKTYRSRNSLNTHRSLAHRNLDL